MNHFKEFDKLREFGKTNPTEEEKKKYIDSLMRKMLPSYYELEELEKKKKESVWYAWDKIKSLKEHMDNIHKGNTAECIDGNGACGEKFDMDEYKVYTQRVVAHTIKTLEKKL